MRALLIGIALLMISGVSAAELSASLERNRDRITYSISNRGSATAQVSAIDFAESRRSGHWLFVYDPNTKKVQHGWATVFRSPQMRAAKPYAVLLRPGEVMSESYSPHELLRLFFSVPECFYLVAVYRDISEKVKRNVVSNALYVCQRS